MYTENKTEDQTFAIDFERELLKSKLNNTIKSFCEEDKDYILKLDLGLGKTRAIIEYFKNYKNNIKIKDSLDHISEDIFEAYTYLNKDQEDKKNFGKSFDEQRFDEEDNLTASDKTVYIILSNFNTNAFDYWDALKNNRHCYYCQSPKELFKDIYESCLEEAHRRENIADTLFYNKIKKDKIDAYPIKNINFILKNVIIATHHYFTQSILHDLIQCFMDRNPDYKLKLIIDENCTNALFSSVDFNLKDLEVININSNPDIDLIGFIEECEEIHSTLKEELSILDLYNSVKKLVKIEHINDKDFLKQLEDSKERAYHSVKEIINILKNKFDGELKQDDRIMIDSIEDGDDVHLPTYKVSPDIINHFKKALISKNLNKQEENILNAYRTISNITRISNPSLYNSEENIDNIVISGWITKKLMSDKERVKFLIADATANPLIYSAILRRESLRDNVIKIFPKVKDNIRLFYIRKDNFVKSKVEEDVKNYSFNLTKTIKEALKNLKFEYNFKDVLISWKSLETELDLKANYYSCAGKNDWEEFDTLFLAGIPQVNADSLGIKSQICSLLKLDIKEFDSRIQFDYKKGYQLKNNKKEDINDKIILNVASQYINFLNESVYTQAIGRIRYHRYLHNPNLKNNLYIFFICPKFQYDMILKYLPESLKYKKIFDYSSYFDKNK